MNVVAFNGSPRTEGNTTHLLGIVTNELEGAGIDTETVEICSSHPRGCTACMQCAKNKDGQCVITSDPVNEWIAKIRDADGVLFGSPTYFANVSAEMKALLDRAGMVGVVNDRMYARKPMAAVIAVRRGGALPAFDAINHMAQINRMLVVGSTYWNFGVGLKPGDALGDDEGVANMRDLGQNMAWLLEKVNA